MYPMIAYTRRVPLRGIPVQDVKPQAGLGFAAGDYHLDSHLGLLRSWTGQAGFSFLITSNDFAYKSPFFWIVEGAIGAEYLVEPLFGLVVRIRLLPGVPRQIRLRLARDQTPVDCCYFVFLCDREDALKGAAPGARHVFRAQNGAVIFLQPADPLFELRRFAIVVKRENIRLLQLNFPHAAKLVRRSPIPLPEATRQGLRGASFPSPCKHFGEKGENELYFVG